MAKGAAMHGISTFQPALGAAAIHYPGTLLLEHSEYYRKKHVV